MVSLVRCVLLRYVSSRRRGGCKANLAVGFGHNLTVCRGLKKSPPSYEVIPGCDVIRQGHKKVFHGLIVTSTLDIAEASKRFTQDEMNGSRDNDILKLLAREAHAVLRESAAPQVGQREWEDELPHNHGVVWRRCELADRNARMLAEHQRTSPRPVCVLRL